MTHPFPYFGQGDARADELAALVVFESSIATSELLRIGATAPARVRSVVRTGARSLWLETSNAYLADVRRWARDEGLTIGKGDDAAYAAISKALEDWILALHSVHPVALFFVDGEQTKSIGAWHAWSMAHYRDRVRPVVEALRAAGDGDHANWIVTNFLKCGAEPSVEDVIALAGEDGPHEIGDLNRRCISIIRLMRVLGDDVLSELGPYVELGYWATAAVPERIADPAGFPERLARLAEACPDKHPSVLRTLLLEAAARMLDDSLPLIVLMEHFPERKARSRSELAPQALTIVAQAAAWSPPSWEETAALIGTIRPLGADLELALARVLLPPALADASESARRSGLEWGQALLEHFRARGDADALHWLETIDALRTPLSEIETGIPGATHPHLARLDATRLTVAYRAAAEPQLVRIRIVGSPHPSRDGSELGGRIRDVIAMVNAGLAGGILFAPELGEAEVVSGPKPGAAMEAAENEWTVRLRAVDGRFFAIALHRLADAWATLGMARDVRYCPKHVSIVGELAVDDSPASARTDDVLGWLRDPSEAYRAWPDPPFEVSAKKKAKTPRFALKVANPEQTGSALNAWLLASVLDAHPCGGSDNHVANTVVSKTQLSLPWRQMSCPAKVAIGPITNLVRRFHFRVAKVTELQFALE